MELQGGQGHPRRARGTQGKAREGVPRAPWGAPGFPLGPPGPPWVPLASLELLQTIWEFPFCLEARRSQGASRTQEEPGRLFLAILGCFGREFPFCLEARRSQGASRTQEEPGDLFLAIFSCFPLVSDGPMVQDLCH